MAKFSLPKIAAGASARRVKRSGTSYIKQHVRERLVTNFGIVGAYAADKVGLSHHKDHYQKEAKHRNIRIKATEPAAAIEESAEQLGGGLNVIEHAISQGGEDIAKELARFSDEVSAKLDAMSNELEALAYQARAKKGSDGTPVAGMAGAAKNAEAGGGWWDVAKGFLAGAFLGKLGKMAVLLARGTPIAAVLASLVTLAAQKRQFELDHPEEAQALRDRWRGGRLLDPAYSGTTEEVAKNGPLARPKFLSVAEIGVELKKRGHSLSDLDPSKRDGNIVFLKDGTRIDLGSQSAVPLRGPEAGAIELPEVSVTQDEQIFDADRIEIEGAKEICFEEDAQEIQGDDSIPRGTTQGAQNRNNPTTNMRGAGNPQMGVKDPNRLPTNSGGWSSHAFTDNPSNVVKWGVTAAQNRVYMSSQPEAIADGWTTKRLEDESTLGLVEKEKIYIRDSTGARRNPLIGQTFDHEAGHHGAQQFYKSSPETKKLFPEVGKYQHFEELRQRLHDKAEFTEKLKADPKNGVLLDRMSQTDHFIKNISEQIAKQKAGSGLGKDGTAMVAGHIVSRAHEYNDHLNKAIGEQPHFKRAPYGFNTVTGQPNPTPQAAQLVDRPESSLGTKGDALAGSAARSSWPKDADLGLRSDGRAGILDLQQLASPPPVPPAPMAPPSRGIGSDFATSSGSQPARREQRQEEPDPERASFTDAVGTGSEE